MLITSIYGLGLVFGITVWTTFHQIACTVESIIKRTSINSSTFISFFFTIQMCSSLKYLINLHFPQLNSVMCYVLLTLVLTFFLQRRSKMWLFLQTHNGRTVRQTLDKNKTHLNYWAYNKNMYSIQLKHQQNRNKNRYGSNHEWWIPYNRFWNWIISYKAGVSHL